jgi:fatty-acyl-CoA synthase
MNPLTVDRMLRDRARTTPGRIAIEAAGREWTYQEMDRCSDELAASLEPGSRVSTLTGNTAEHVVVFFACAKAGAILHPISWRLAPAEIAWQLDDAEPAVFLVEEEHRELGEAALALAQVAPAFEPPAPSTVRRPPFND